jgi:hypothetical protein
MPVLEPYLAAGRSISVRAAGLGALVAVGMAVFGALSLLTGIVRPAQLGRLLRGAA